MKQLTALILALLLASLMLPGVSAQASNTIWMETNKNAYGAGEVITITIKANTDTPIQGINFNLRYDPACLVPDVPTSQLPQLSYMVVPQTPGLVNAIFAGTSKVDASGGLASINFSAVDTCQTTLTLEKADLVVASDTGMAVSLPGISLGTSSLLINVSAGKVAAAPLAATAPTAVPTNTLAKPQSATPIASAASSSIFDKLILPISVLCGGLLLTGLIIAAVSASKKRKSSHRPQGLNMQKSTLLIQRGPQAGNTLPLVSFPCRIGSSSENEICLEDGRIAPAHAEILADSQGFTLLDLGNSPDGTFINGVLIKNQQTALRYGDVLRLGGVLLVFKPA